MNEINENLKNIIETTKIYNLFDDIFKLDKKDAEGRKKKIESIILNYL